MTLSAEFKDLEALQSQLEEKKTGMRVAAIEEIKALMDVFAISPAELGIEVVEEQEEKATGRRGKRGPVAAKYRLPTGEEWSGRGRTPVAFQMYMNEHGIQKHELPTI